MLRPLAAALAVAFVVCLAPATAGAAAQRSVPRGWLGVIADGPLTREGAALSLIHI